MKDDDDNVVDLDEFRTFKEAQERKEKKQEEKEEMESLRTMLDILISQFPATVEPIYIPLDKNYLYEDNNTMYYTGDHYFDYSGWEEPDGGTDEDV